MTSVPSSGVPAWRDKFNGVFFVGLLALAVVQLAQIPAIKSFGISPLVIGIVCGMLYGNFFKGAMPADWGVGVHFTARKLLRVAVALYGLNISVQQIVEVGLPGVVVAIGVAVSVLALGTWLGTHWLGLD
ncbi:MAG: putative sulfate exporter family transporter, partial [Orrella sp.]